MKLLIHLLGRVSLQFLLIFDLPQVIDQFILIVLLLSNAAFELLVPFSFIREVLLHVFVHLVKVVLAIYHPLQVHRLLGKLLMPFINFVFLPLNPV